MGERRFSGSKGQLVCASSIRVVNVPFGIVAIYDERDEFSFIQYYLDCSAFQVSSISQVGILARFKQWVAESIAGQYDREAINRRIDETLANSPVVMFSFTTCPFCLKAKGLLQEDLAVDPSKLTVRPPRTTCQLRALSFSLSYSGFASRRL
jgi:hypothetical protein